MKADWQLTPDKEAWATQVSASRTESQRKGKLYEEHDKRGVQQTPKRNVKAKFINN